MVLNQAFVFVKPHAVTEKTLDLVSQTLSKRGCAITREGEVSAERIDDERLVDRHYYAIASKATLVEAENLSVPNDKFRKAYGVEWSDVCAKGLAMNSKKACEKWKMTPTQLDQVWQQAKQDGKMTKLGGGFYCAKIKDCYVFNGFYMTMRSKFVKPGTCIHYYVVEWDSAKMSWEEFRGELLGPTEPSKAPETSLRGIIYNDWEALGLKMQPTTGENGVHASASPFEACAEMNNWLGMPFAETAFGAALLDAGISEDSVKAWSIDPQVTYGVPSMRITGSLFDALEDADADKCGALCEMIHAETARMKDGMRVVAAGVLGAVIGFLLPKNGRR
ncbi:Nucleoside diphosphate kinase [Ostreococcus tauri]|uniref:Nucleoside diphosphate kinase n=1 Tax=Ostreococcus tauri TaxID=70448 RepID=A0A090M5D7_OSTTA|nr:Nucleoside diphosphate kinase [Ostreococcus tauri]OUS43229.1 nucleoside diphosphate kinase [Ostreococcus tauri]CEF99450.1 Nucleoside diphosphate kinase [Ostreococcus tauri]|eukprot:XP_003081727.2 Nucleoside diphosphate kinase [Ostreococcus tauri]